MTVWSSGFLMVSAEVSTTPTRFPIFGVGNRTRNFGNLLRNHALGAALHGFHAWKLFRGWKPQVSTWFPHRFPNGRG